MPSYINTGNGFDVLPAGGVFFWHLPCGINFNDEFVKAYELELLKAKRVKPTMIFGYHKKPLTKNDRMKGQVDQYIYPPNLDWNSSFDVNCGRVDVAHAFRACRQGFRLRWFPCLWREFDRNTPVCKTQRCYYAV
jgi:hypothetical protein